MAPPSSASARPIGSSASAPANSAAPDMTATAFTPVASLLGGAMIGAAAVMLLAAVGRIAGISGIAVRLLPPYQDDGFAGRLAFIAGLVAAPLIMLLATGAAPVPTIAAGPGLLILAGLLVGFGAVWGNGCTSGHGVCGLSRLSLRSLVATLVFMGTAMATVFLTRHVL
ncbi:YeeE/YedE family protein [Humitalea sp. 24SJ18S-53]|uniref:YeeE/YedE family protein n=1 Tax=Humitalea sp. 24SJ18S-53 TaxID=3422307 RepID=UPI003D668FD9